MVANDYTLKIMNMTETPRTFIVRIDGLEGIHLGENKQITADSEVTAGPAENLEVNIEVMAPRESGQPGSNRIYLDVVSKDDPNVKRREKAVFLYPN